MNDEYGKKNSTKNQTPNRKGNNTMPIIDTVTDYSRLYHDLKRMERDNFSYDGARALMEYLDELSDDMGEPIKYDPIAFCCDFAEYLTEEYETLAQEYSHYDECPQFENYNQDGHDIFTDNLINWLNQETTVIEFKNGIIIKSF